jgi:hypothetical protein
VDDIREMRPLKVIVHHVMEALSQQFSFKLCVILKEHVKAFFYAQRLSQPLTRTHKFFERATI